MTLLTMIFVAFFAIIIVFQAIPATLMFFGMLKGLAKGGADVKETN